MFYINVDKSEHFPEVCGRLQLRVLVGKSEGPPPQKKYISQFRNYEISQNYYQVCVQKAGQAQTDYNETKPQTKYNQI